MRLHPVVAVPRRLALAIALLALVCMGCNGDDGGRGGGDTVTHGDTADIAEPDGIGDLEREPMPVRCVASFSVSSWHPLGADEDTFFIGSVSMTDLSQTSRGGVTRDRGRRHPRVGLRDGAAGAERHRRLRPARGARRRLLLGDGQ